MTWCRPEETGSLELLTKHSKMYQGVPVSNNPMPRSGIAVDFVVPLDDESDQNQMTRAHLNPQCFVRKLQALFVHNSFDLKSYRAVARTTQEMVQRYHSS